jgi:transposase
MQSTTTIAVDVAKSVFEIAVSEKPGQVSERHRLTRAKFERFFVGRESATVVMEACGSAHYWGRRIQADGHKVRLLPPHAVRPYITRNKTDRTDAKGILEALRNDEIKPVPVKTEEQQALTAMHRIRSSWMVTRTTRLNTLRGILRELGFTIPVGADKVVPHVWALLNDRKSTIPKPLRHSLAELCDEIGQLEDRVKELEKALRAEARTLPMARKLMTVPGVGLLTGTALVAFVGDVQRFPSGRHFSSFLGITPRERSSGGVRRLGKISKQGDAYIRTLLIHGARAVLLSSKKMGNPDSLRSWALRVEQRRGHNKATTALANKLARIVWAVWRSETSYRGTAKTKLI